MFSEKRAIPQGKISLGKILEIHKFCWPFVTLAMTLYYNNYSYRMYLMNGYFGCYGFLWVLKSNLFYDKNFYLNEHHINGIGTSLINFLSISVYFLFPYVTVTNNNEITKIETLISIVFYTIGMFFHHGSDAQKYYTLKYQKGKLITDGFYSIVQNPNYSGEFLIWIALIVTSGYNKMLSYLPLVWLYLATILVGIPEKRKSLQKYENYQHWSTTTKQLIPGIY